MEFVLADISECKKLSYFKRKFWDTMYIGVYDDSDIDNYDYIAREDKFKKLILGENQEVYVC